MTDVELLEKKLAFIETCVRELRQLGRPERIEHDVREQRFIAYTLQIAIQAALDIASHIVSNRRLGEPRTNQELFALVRTGPLAVIRTHADHAPDGRLSQHRRARLSKC